MTPTVSRSQPLGCILDGKCDFLNGCDHICIPLEASLSSYCPMLSSLHVDILGFNELV